MDENKHNPADSLKNGSRKMSFGLGTSSSTVAGKARWFGHEQNGAVPTGSPSAPFLQQLKNLEKKY